MACMKHCFTILFFSSQGEWETTSSKKKKKQPAVTKSDSVIETKPIGRDRSPEREINEKPERDRENYAPRDRRNRQPPRLASMYMYCDYTMPVKWHVYLLRSGTS